MTHEEKAKELVEKFYPFTLYTDASESGKQHALNRAKQCALICCEEIIEALEAFGYSGAMYDDYETGRITFTDDKLPDDYFRKVKEEIEKLSNEL